MIVTSKSHAQALQVVKADLHEKIAELSQKFEQFESGSNEKLDTLNEALVGLRSQFDGLSERQEDAASKLGEELKRVQALHRKLERTVGSFQALRDKASKKLLDEAKIEVREQLQKLTAGMADFKKVEVDLKSLRQGMEEASRQMKTFSDAAGKLRKSDFTLKQFSGEIEKRERETVRLARENERLKSLVGKMRRGRPQSGPRGRRSDS